MPASRPAPGSIWLFVAGLAHAALLLLAFPPFGLWGFAIAAPIPLVWAAKVLAESLPKTFTRAASRWRRIARVFARPTMIVSAGILPAQLYAHQWVFEVSALGYIPMAVLMSLFTGTFVGLGAVLARRWPRVPLTLVAPIAWTAIEVFRGEVIGTGFPWLLTAHPLIDAPYIPTAAAFLGTYFVGFLVVCFGAALLEMIRSRRYLHGADGVAFVLACLVGARALVPAAPTGAPFKVAVVQTNIPQSNKIEWSFAQRMKDFRRFVELTRLAAGPRPDVIVWPETMFPGSSLSEQAVREERDAGLSFDAGGRSEPTIQFHDQLLTVSAELGIPMLVGALGYEELQIRPGPNGGVRFSQKARFNSVFLVSKGTVDPVPYSKIDLTPFGEVMPYVNHWPWLQGQILALGANGMAFDLSPGPGPRVFPIKDGQVSVVTPICFEATKPALCRKLVRAAAGSPVVIVNLTNDGWFGSFRPGRLQHLQIARWRSVELGVPMVRAANTGISAAIDSTGRVLATGLDGSPGAWNADGVLSASVIPAVSRTVYAKVGNVFGWSVVSITGLALAAMLVQRRMKPPSIGDPE